MRRRRWRRRARSAAPRGARRARRPSRAPARASARKAPPWAASTCPPSSASAVAKSAISGWPGSCPKTAAHSAASTRRSAGALHGPCASRPRSTVRKPGEARRLAQRGEPARAEVDRVELEQVRRALLRVGVGLLGGLDGAGASVAAYGSTAAWSIRTCRAAAATRAHAARISSGRAIRWEYRRMAPLDDRRARVLRTRPTSSTWRPCSPAARRTPSPSGAGWRAAGSPSSPSPGRARRATSRSIRGSRSPRSRTTNPYSMVQVRGRVAETARGRRGAGDHRPALRRLHGPAVPDAQRHRLPRRGRQGPAHGPAVRGTKPR